MNIREILTNGIIQYGKTVEICLLLITLKQIAVLQELRKYEINFGVEINSYYKADSCNKKHHICETHGKAY